MVLWRGDNVNHLFTDATASCCTHEVPCPHLQGQAAAAAQQQACTGWQALVQQLTPESVDKVDEGQAVVTSVLAELEQLRAEQRSSFELMAANAEALASAQTAKGGVKARL